MQVLKCTFDINELHKINISSLQTQEATTRYSDVRIEQPLWERDAI